MRIKLTGPQSAAIAPVLLNVPSATVGATVLNVPDDDAPLARTALMEAPASAPLTAVIRKLDAAISDYVTDSEAETAAVLSDPDAMEAIAEARAEERHVEMPERQAAVLRAIADGGYGSGARGLVRDNPRRNDETATRWLARIRHRLYMAGNDRAGDALQSIGGQA